MLKTRTPSKSVRVLRLRLKDKHAPMLRRWSRAVNMVWNFCNDLSVRVFERERRFIGGFELQGYLNGASKEGLEVGSPVFQQVADEFATRRRQFKKVRLAWRKSGGARRSLGWVPFKTRSLMYKNGQIRFNGELLSLWDSYGLAAFAKQGALGSGSISEDARGRWYINICVSVPELCGPSQPGPTKDVGLDLGLKDFMVTSAGRVEAANQFYRDLEPALAVSQRARHKTRTRAIHAKIANRRKDFQHKLSRELVNNHALIFVGNVNAAGLAKTNMAKSVLDAGWSTFRTMLQYKCAHAGVWFEEVNEAFSTQTCSACSARSGPKGLQGLGIREWTCTACDTVHHRDVNAAKNILARGHARLAVGIPVL